MKGVISTPRGGGGPGATATGIEQTFTVGGTPSAGYGKYRFPSAFKVFSNGPFFPSGKGHLGGYPPGLEPAQTLAIFHELAHDIIQNGKYLIPNDGNDPDLSVKNSRLVNEKCGDFIFKGH